MKLSVKALNLKQAILYFIIASTPFFIGIYFIIPSYVSENSNNFWPFALAIILPLLLLLIYAILIGIKEKSSEGLKGVLERWNLKKMKKNDWLWTFVLISIIFIGYFGLSKTPDWIVGNFPFINPPEEFNLIRTENSFFGLPLKGNWWILLLHILILIINVLGEELFFRGVIFPKQKLYHGKHTWIAHGLCYHLFHMFYPWDFFRILPESLAYAFVRQKTDNTLPGIIAHFVFNSLGIIGTITGIMG